MAKKKMCMYYTFKTDIFGKVNINGRELPTVSILSGRLVINAECCDLRTIKERYNPETKELAPSGVNSIFAAESVMAMHYGKRREENSNETATETAATTEHNTLYDFITVDCSSENDSNEAKQIKDLLCYDGLYLPLSKLEAVGYVPHNEAEIAEIEGVKYVRYRAAMQSASENRQCKLTMTTYQWESFAKTISGNARYLYEPTQTAQKAIARQGLGKTNGNIIENFKFTFAAVPDLETDIYFSARCYSDTKNEITTEAINAKRVATDGCGFISPAKAKELANFLELPYLPSAFQVRYGQVKGILLVFDFQKYSSGKIKEDILFTDSMRKSEFDTEKAQFLVANVSKPPRGCTEWNYQMLTTLNNSLSFSDIEPYVEELKAYMEKALSCPEAALKFLGILADISTLDGDGENGENGYDCVDKVSAVIQANPQLAMNIRWVKQSIKRKIDLVSKKMLFGKIPMPQSDVAIMAPDPLAFFNRLRLTASGAYSFTDGELVVPTHKQATELATREFYRNGFEGELLAFRNPLTHHAQIRKLQCVNYKNSAYWYRFLGQVVMLNAHDETAAGMGGADFDGDMCIISQLFTDKFKQADFIIYNNNDTGGKQVKVILTEQAVQRGIRANLQQNMLGIICNINTRCLELLNDPSALRKMVLLAGHTENRSFDVKAVPQMPYKPKFQDEQTAVAYLENLNHQLTTLSELEVDRPKTGYINRFCANQQEYALPFTPYWFAKIKGQLGKFQNRHAEALSQSRLGEAVRTLTKSYNDGKLIKTINDTLKHGRRSNDFWVQRTIDMMSDGDTIMANVQRFVQEQILDMEIDIGSCFSIVESLKGSSILDMDEVTRITENVRSVFKGYCREIAGNIRAMKNGGIDRDDFNNALENTINNSGEQLRAISSDRAALAYTAYVLSLENSYGSQSFPFLTVLDGMVALLNDVRAIDYYEINLRREIPRGQVELLDSADYIIVYNRQCRLPERLDPSKTYFGDMPLPNGRYELYRGIKGGVSLIVPKPARDKANVIPFNATAEFSLKISYKASELSPDNQNGGHVTQLMANSGVTFRESTIKGNVQYCVYAGEAWVGTVFDDQSNGWVLRKEIVKTLLGNEYVLVGIPKTGVKTNSNSFTTSTGKARSAQVLTFIKAQAKPVGERLPIASAM
ncbi:MAG: RNA dependent RNA polymerase [Defluviitaleaceae bacterium]|nr:RNA dependent RNA polymerase [Defluviitaleaceae bacterium]